MGVYLERKGMLMLHPVSINPNAIYDDGSLRQALGLTDATLAAARRNSSLRFTRQGKRTFYLGQWVLDWLETTAKELSEARHTAGADGGGR